MALILSLETSTSVCSVALHRSGVLLSLSEIDVTGAHSERLMGLIEEVITEAGISIVDLSAVAVSSGPGSYTGLRIGVSAAKGLAFGWGVPLIGVETLGALAKAANGEMQGRGFAVPLIDARRDEVYCQVFDSENNFLSAIRAEILTENSFQNYLDQASVYFIGDGVEKTKEIIKHPNAEFLSLPISSKYVGELAFSKFQTSQFEDIAYFVPNYLKEFKVLKSKKNPFKR